MIRRLFRAVFLAGLVAGGVAVVRALTRAEEPLPRPAAAPTGGPWPPLHNESPAPGEAVSSPAPEASKAGTATEPPATEPAEPDAVVAPEPGGTPGQLNYDRTTPDRCYVSAEAAEADGLRAAKR